MNVRTEHIQPYVYKSLMPFESITFSRNKLTHVSFWMKFQLDYGADNRNI